MRMRKKKHWSERIDACSRFLIKDTALLSDDPQASFGTHRKLALEIGCGKGSFAVGRSARDTDTNLIALEKISDVAVTALERAAASEGERPDNLRFVIGDAKEICPLFPESSIDRIYINFCDPWPKKGHTKRRLTYRGFLELYKRILKPCGMLIFKTDNEGLFDFSLEEFEALGLEVVYMTRDLHAETDENAKNNVMTEYERNFSSKGMPIYSAHVRFEKAKGDVDAAQ